MDQKNGCHSSKIVTPQSPVLQSKNLPPKKRIRFAKFTPSPDITPRILFNTPDKSKEKNWSQSTSSPSSPRLLKVSVQLELMDMEGMISEVNKSNANRKE